MDDLISRKELLEELKGYAQHVYECDFDSESCTKVGMSANPQIVEGLWEAKEIIEDMPSYNNPWIPVAERLPTQEECEKNEGRFMVTDEDGVHEGVYDILANGYNDPKWPFQYFDPIAWMPLPEPYKAE